MHQTDAPLTGYRPPDGALKISRAMTANHCCLALAGTLNAASAAALPGIVEQLAERSAGILVDACDLTAIDEAGVQALKRCLEICQARQVVLSVSGIKGAVGHTLHASGEAHLRPFVRG